MASKLELLQRALSDPTILLSLLDGYDDPAKFRADAPTRMDVQSLAFVHDNRTLRLDPVNIEAIWSFAQASSWEEGLKFLTRLDSLEWAVPIRGYQAAVSVERKNIERPGHMVNLQQIVAGLGPALWDVGIEKVYHVLASNPDTAIGTSLYDTNHEWPNGHAFSNVLHLDQYIANVAAATTEECRAFLRSVALQLVKQVNLRTKIFVHRPASANNRRIALVIRHWDLYQSFIALHDDLEIALPGGGTRTNDVRATFTVHYDGNSPVADPAGFDADHLITAVDTTAQRIGGLPTMFFIEDENPTEPEAKELPPDRDRTKLIVVSDFQMGIKVGLPHGVVLGTAAATV